MNLSSSNATAATVPNTVIIPAGSSTATFIVAAVDDAIAGGNQVSMITAAANGFVAGAAPITMVDDETATLSFVLAAGSIPESGGTTTATVTRNTPTALPLVVTLNSSDTSVVVVPSTTTIPAGSVSASLVVTAVDDDIAGGNRISTLTASASGLVSGTTQIIVNDNETATLSLVLASGSMSENGGTTIGTVTRNTPTAAPLVVNLSNSNSTATTVPSGITIPAGSASATFSVAAVNDSVADGNELSLITASANGLVSGTAPVIVVDDDIATLFLSLAASAISEANGTTIGTVLRNTPTTQELVIDLTSSDATAATVPTFVIIPAGSFQATFEVKAVNDAIAEGNQVSIITASADGLISGAAPVIVIDDETATLSLVFTAGSVLENVGTTTGTVTRNTPATAALIVNLSSSDTSVATVPTLVTILQGELHANFNVSIVDDWRYRGNTSTLIRASAAGLNDAFYRLDVIEDDPQWPWHNSHNPVDVNFDGLVSPIDVLLVINRLNSGGGGGLPDPHPGGLTPPPYVDVNRDGSVSPIDVLLVINHLNSLGSAEGESEIRNSIASQTFGDYGWLDSLVIDSRQPKRRQR